MKCLINVSVFNLADSDLRQSNLNVILIFFSIYWSEWSTPNDAAFPFLLKSPMNNQSQTCEGLTDLMINKN